MSTTQYKIHLPHGTVLTARNATQLDEFMNLNLVRLYQPRQIRIEPVFDCPKRRGRNSLLCNTLETDSANDASQAKLFNDKAHI